MTAYRFHEYENRAWSGTNMPRTSRVSICCGRGETGRRKGLKIPRLRSYGFDSRRPHHEFPPPSRKEQRGEFTPGADRRRIDRPPGVEKLQQLLARAIVVPGPVAFDDFNELGGRLLAPVLGIEQDGEIEPRLMVAGIGRDLTHQLGSIADGGGLSGEVERRSGGNDRGVTLAAGGHRGQNSLGAFELACGNEELRPS